MLKYQFPAVRGNQAGKEYYICMVPMGLLSRIFLMGDSDVPPEYRAADGTIALRCPDSTLVRTLARSIGAPLATTSANTHGEAAATSGAAVEPAIVAAADLTLDAGPAPVGVASTIVSCLGKEPQVLVTLGTLQPKLCRRFSIKQPVFAAEISWPVLFSLIKRDKFSFKELPKFPEVRRDLALLVDESVSYAELERSALKAGKKLIKRVGLFDVYRGDKIPAGKKQYALNFVLQDPERTLTDGEVEAVMGKVLSSLQAQFGATLR